MELSWLGTNTALIINNTGNIIMIGLLSVCVCVHHTDSDSQQANLYHILDPQYDSVDNKTSMFILDRCTIYNRNNYIQIYRVQSSRVHSSIIGSNHKEDKLFVMQLCSTFIIDQIVVTGKQVPMACVHFE